MKKINYYRIHYVGLGTYLKSTDVFKGTKKEVKREIKKLKNEYGDKYGDNYDIHYEKIE